MIMLLDFFNAVRPSSIRVTESAMKMDARRWRVTVFIDKNNIIQSIDQEVEVGIPGSTNEEIDKNHEILHEMMVGRRYENL